MRSRVYHQRGRPVKKSLLLLIDILVYNTAKVRQNVMRGGMAEDPDGDLLRPPKTPGMRGFRRGGCVELGLVIVVALVAFVFFFSVAAQSVPKLGLTASGTPGTPSGTKTSVLATPTEVAVEAEPTPSPTPAQQKVRVANTGGLGAFIKKDPKPGASGLVAMAEGAVLTIVGPDFKGDDGVWRNVQDDKGNIGWIFSEYLVPVP